jgi:hypothetical protein
MARRSLHISRLLWTAAVLLGLVGQALFWLSVPVPSTLFSSAAPRSFTNETPVIRAHRQSIAHSPELQRLVQSSVDTTALSLGAVFQSLPGDATRLAVLSSALNSLTFDLGGDIYFTAWDGTRILHSPLTPDIDGSDFAEATDQHGQPFVREMAELAAKGGGRLLVSLPRPKNLGPPQGSELAPGLEMEPDDSLAPLPENGIPVSMELPPLSGKALAANLPPPPAVRESETVDQMLYTRRIPNSPWHLVAFTPLDGPDREKRGFSSVFSDGYQQKVQAQAEDSMRYGLRLFGFALTGLAGLMLALLYNSRYR